MKEHKLITLKLINFNATENKNLDLILTLAERNLTAEWQVVDIATADFFIFSPSSAKQIDSDTNLQKLAPEQCIFCSIDKNNANMLLIDSNGIPRLSALINLFNKLSEQPSTISAQTNIPTQSTSNLTDEENFFNFEKGFLGYLLNTTDECFSATLSNKPNDYPIYINKAGNCYYSQHKLEQLKDYITATDNLVVTSCSTVGFEYPVETNHLKAHPLKNLIWYTVIETSGDKVIKGHASSDIVTLKKWPNLRLSGCIRYAKLATFMKNNAVTLKTASEQTKMPLIKLYPFYNACYLLGLIELKLETELNQKQLDPAHLNLLSQIGNRLEK